MSSLSCPKQSQFVYRPRRPEKTVLFEVVKKYYKTWRSNSVETIPKYVDDAFRKYLECGILANGFACAHCGSCGKDFFLAFSCRGRGICPSCNTRAMVQTAAHLLENVIPCVPVRQFVISFPKRIRYYLQTHSILQSILRIVVDEIRKKMIACNPDVSDPKIGAVSFIQYFGNTLNLHPHIHLVVADGIFSEQDENLLFYEAFLTSEDVLEIEDRIRRRVLKYFHRRGFFSKDEVATMLTYENSGFSLDATVRIQSSDRDGLERLIRYCARPAFKSENLRMNGPWVNYRLPKRTQSGQTCIQMEPIEFLEKISKFIPFPRRHRRHYHGVFAPHSPLREKVAANAQQRLKSSVHPVMKETVNKVEKASLSWAKLIARIYEVNPLICSCGHEIKITAFVTHSAEIRRILSGIGWPCKTYEFDQPQESADITVLEICQLIPWTEDGFPENGPDPPFLECQIDPPHWADDQDPPHWCD